MSLIPQLGEQFNYKDGQIFGHDCVLITPKDMGVDWNDENKHYRSVVIRKSDGKVVSKNWRKFVNLGEKPDFEPWNPEWPFDAREKVDGSALLVSKLDGHPVIRTRGTMDARHMSNGDEIDFLVQKYPKVFDNFFVNSEEFTVLLEWTTPTNKIVIRESDEPDIVLLGVIDNKSSVYLSQPQVDDLGVVWGIRRPKRYHYNNLVECIDDVKTWKGKEGVVLYHEETQTLKKIKATDYLRLHKLKSHISSISNLVDFYMTTSKSADYDEFFKVVEQSLDFELATQAAKDIEKVVDTHKQIVRDSAKVSWFLEDVRHDPRKEAAAKIIAKYTDWRKSYAFMALDNKPMPDKMLAELIFQTCKN